MPPFVLVGAGGLIVTANLAPIAKDLKVDGIQVSLIGLTLPALTFAATIDRVLNGLTRPFFGWVSDNIGRENTMFIAFFIEGVGIFLLYMYGADPVWFVILSGLVFFAWGEIYSLFPSTNADTFGSKFAAANAGLLYTATGAARLAVTPTFSLRTGSRVPLLRIRLRTEPPRMPSPRPPCSALQARAALAAARAGKPSVRDYHPFSLAPTVSFRFPLQTGVFCPVTFGLHARPTRASRASGRKT